LRKLSFSIEKTFPSSDPPAIDIFRLMAGYNDMVLVIEWLEAHLKEPEDFDEKTWAAGRLDLQIRSLFGVMHESLNVLIGIQQQPEFPKLEGEKSGDILNFQARGDPVRSSSHRLPPHRSTRSLAPPE
jgi:hypothetical protein